MFSLRTALGLVLAASQVQALYFYMDGQTPKCFYEELPKDTLVVGKYTATYWDEQARNYIPNAEVGILITVDETFDNDHRIVSQRGAASGKFTFSAHDAGDHRLCFTPTNVPHTSGFLFSGSQVGGIKLELDMAIGETSRIERDDKGKITDVVKKVKDINARLADIRREQSFQREREAEFRDQSEKVNARVVKWFLIQMAVLGVTCAWQLSYLRSFFIKQKLT